MPQPDIIQTILKDSNYHLDLFTDPEVQSLRQKIFIKTVRGKETPHIIVKSIINYRLYYNRAFKKQCWAVTTQKRV